MKNRRTSTVFGWRCHINRGQCPHFEVTTTPMKARTALSSKVETQFHCRLRLIQTTSNGPSDAPYDGGHDGRMVRSTGLSTVVSTVEGPVARPVLRRIRKRHSHFVRRSVERTDDEDCFKAIPVRRRDSKSRIVSFFMQIFIYIFNFFLLSHCTAIFCPYRVRN